MYRYPSYMEIHNISMSGRNLLELYRYELFCVRSYRYDRNEAWGYKKIQSSAYFFNTWPRLLRGKHSTFILSIFSRFSSCHSSRA